MGSLPTDTVVACLGTADRRLKIERKSVGLEAVKDKNDPVMGFSNEAMFFVDKPKYLNISYVKMVQYDR